MGVSVKKTLERVKMEIGGHWKDIKAAYTAHKYGLKIELTVNLGMEDGQITASPTIEFFPEPKKKNVKYTVKIDEKQLSFFVYLEAIS